MIMNQKHKYSSVLRVIIPNEKSPLFDSLIESLERYPNCVNEVVFFTQFTHSIRPAKEMIAMAENLNGMMNRIKALGYSAGIDVLCTVGHHPEYMDPSLENLNHFTDAHGKTNMGRLCAASPATFQYIQDVYTAFAKTNPSIIYIDDDIDYGCGCYCQNCLNQFEEKTNLFSTHHKEISSENLIHLFSNPETEYISKKEWMNFNQNRIKSIFEAIEKSVHAIDPNIELGFMTCNVKALNGLDTDHWAQALQGDTGAVRCRPGGGVYNDINIDAALAKAHNIARQIRYLRDFVRKVESELENFPYQSLKKSVKFTEFEVMLYLASGCTGTAFNVCSGFLNNYDEHEKYIKLAEDLIPFGSDMVNTFGRNEPEGIGCYWNKNTFAKLPGESWETDDIAFLDEFYQIGLPISYNPENMSVFMLSGKLAQLLSDEEILMHLSRGLFMDTSALTILNQRGFSKYTGFKVVGSYQNDTLERDLDSNFNIEGRSIRDARQSFGWCESADSILKTSEEASYLTELINYSYTHQGYGCGIYENELGGRICVSGYAPFDWCNSLPRTIQLKNIFKWLSGSKLKAYVKSFNKGAIWCRKTADDQSGVILANLSLDDARDMEVAVLNGSTSITMTTNMENKSVQTILEKSDIDNEYSIYKIPVLRSLSVCYLSDLK